MSELHADGAVCAPSCVPGSCFLGLQGRDILKWFHEHGYRGPEVIAGHPPVQGDLKLLKFLRRNGYNVAQALAHWVIQANNLQVVAWLLKKGTKVTAKDLQAAIFCGKLEMLKLLHASRKDWKTEDVEVEEYTSAEILKWLNDQWGCATFGSTCDMLYATNSGKLHNGYCNIVM